ncbi:hepatocyte growth factor receptor-like [Ruditapes philippinarum]|uniref:hepatocyte growth factor receptor-like n=1 Tax=Ruditapes philippinarum TaxID=129788 RepID=UPI00295C11FA|nr:hepatocyte growth factor receptor-like [Ruditapes philippinarum]
MGIICVSGSSQNEISGIVSISVNGLRSSSDFIFFYRIPVVTGIVPNYGPKAGGTRITLFGENIGIGNRNVNVKLDNFRCLRPEVRPKLSFENITLTNFTIVCTTAGIHYSISMDVYVEIDGREIKTPYPFTLVDNPIIQPFSPKMAFLSGGTKIKVEGEKLNNAHNARFTVNYMQDIEVNSLNIFSNLFSCRAKSKKMQTVVSLCSFHTVLHVV